MLKTLFRLSLLVMFFVFRVDAETLKVRASRFIGEGHLGLSVRLIGVDTPETRFPREAPRTLRPGGVPLPSEDPGWNNPPPRIRPGRRR
jgi:hypothetical protein